MVDTAAATILTARESIFHFFRSLPICVLITFFLFGSFQGNIVYILFAIGLGIFAPLIAVVSNIVLEFIFKWLDDKYKFGSNYWSIPNGASCTLFETLSKNPMGAMNSVPTTWTVMTSFIFVYLFMNAYDIYNRDVPKYADPVAVNARKTRCAMSMFAIVLVGVLVLLARFSITHCETALGMFIGLGLGIWTGTSWYGFLRKCGVGQFDDIFGISNRLLSREASGDKAPKVCVPVNNEEES